jgi:hypothetical protein
MRTHGLRRPPGRSRRRLIARDARLIAICAGVLRVDVDDGRRRPHGVDASGAGGSGHPSSSPGLQAVEQTELARHLGAEACRRHRDLRSARCHPGRLPGGQGRIGKAGIVDLHGLSDRSDLSDAGPILGGRHRGERLDPVSHQPRQSPACGMSNGRFSWGARRGPRLPLGLAGVAGPGSSFSTALVSMSWSGGPSSSFSFLARRPRERV